MRVSRVRDASKENPKKLKFKKDIALQEFPKSYIGNLGSVFSKFMIMEKLPYLPKLKL